MENGIRIEKLLDQTLSQFLPPSVIVDGSDNIIHTINDVTPFVKIQPGQFSSNIFDNLPPDLGLFISSLLRKLKKDGESSTVESLIDLKGFENQKITLLGKKILTDRSEYYVVSFSETPAVPVVANIPTVESPTKKGMAERVGELEKELQFTKESLQATVEELETSNEELQSSNEELIASNEELQSTNEELQSVNE